MRRILVSVIVLVSFLTFPVWANDAALEQAYASQQSDLQIKGEGEVVRILPDDTHGAIPMLLQDALSGVSSETRARRNMR